MSLKFSPDYAQEVMENIFHDVEDADVYIDDFVLSPIPGMTIWNYCTPYYLNCRTMSSQLTHSNVNGQSRRLIG
jgi:hypothetical protein